jgi:hypothetical protein
MIAHFSVFKGNYIVFNENYYPWGGSALRNCLVQTKGAVTEALLAADAAGLRFN